MQRTNPKALALWCAGLVAFLGGVSLWKGGFYASRYEGDMLHLVEMVLRVGQGELPHRDFMTPLGILSVWPMAVFVAAGDGIGMAIHKGQMLVALTCLPAVFWSAYSRFAGGWAWLYAALPVVMVLALFHGTPNDGLSMSMHYNRWAWALVFIAAPLALLPPLGRRRPWADALALGLPMAAVVLIKVTYAVALAPGLLLALALRGEWRLMAGGVAAALAGLGAATLWLGPGYWAGYVGDLLAVARSDLRAHPGLEFDQMLTAPAYMGGYMLSLLALVLLRQTGKPLPQALAAAMLLLLPGLAYVTFQNFGNDPQWLAPLALIVLMARPEGGLRNGWGWDLRAGLGLVAAGMLALASPSWLNMGYSPLRHVAADPAEHAPIFAGLAQHDDFYTERRRAFEVNMIMPGDTAAWGLASFAAENERQLTPPLQGWQPPECELGNGLVAWFGETARRLEAGGLAAGTRIFTADLLSGLWMFVPGSEPLRHGAPWRYGGLPGLADATHVLVPSCAVLPKSRAEIVTELMAAEVPLRLVQDTPLYRLYALDGDQSQAASNR